jgi:protein ImuB
LRDSLSKLGIHDLGHFITLPPDSIRRRFGREAHDLHALSRNTHTTPLKPFTLDEPARRVHPFDVAETNRTRLVTQLSPMLTALLHDLSDRRQALEHIRLSLTLDDRRYLLESLTPASPTLNSVHLLDLLRLRIDSLVLSAGVVEMMIEGHGINAAAHQLEMFHDAHTRDRSAVNDAFAAIRAEFGNDAILYARLQDAHLPESRVDWAPLQHLPPARPRITTAVPLVRRLYDKPVALPLQADKPPSGMLIARAADGPIEEVIGPHTVRSHWWHVPVTRAYYYVRTQRGRWLWIFHDTTQHQWYMHGEVE